MVAGTLSILVLLYEYAPFIYMFVIYKTTTDLLSISSTLNSLDVRNLINKNGTANVNKAFTDNFSNRMYIYYIAGYCFYVSIKST